jgi:hypothetical protein
LDWRNRTSIKLGTTERRIKDSKTQGRRSRNKSNKLENAAKEVRTTALFLVHIGILASFVKISNKSSAEAMNVVSTTTVSVFSALFAFFTAGAFAAGVGTDFAAAAVGVDAPAMGVPARLGSALTC